MWPDQEKVIDLCIKHRMCCITLRKYADIHHAFSKVGMGQDRNKLDHSKYLRLPLTREKHNECHNIGDEAFTKKYRVYPIYSEHHRGVVDEYEELKDS